MTNYKQVWQNKPRPGNRVDGPPLDRPQTVAQQKTAEAEWCDAGFTRQWVRDAPRLVYTWKGDFPVFIIAPGIIEDDNGAHEGLVARCEAAEDVEILFTYGSSPLAVAARLNDKILDMMPSAADELPFDWRPAPDEIDFDDFIEERGEWVSS